MNRALVAGEITVRAVIADYHDPTAWSDLVTWLQSALGAVVVVHGGGGGHPRPASAVAAVASAFALKEAPCFLTSDTSGATGLAHVEAAVHALAQTSPTKEPPEVTETSGSGNLVTYQDHSDYLADWRAGERGLPRNGAVRQRLLPTTPPRDAECRTAHAPKIGCWPARGKPDPTLTPCWLPGCRCTAACVSGSDG